MLGTPLRCLSVLSIALPLTALTATRPVPRVASKVRRVPVSLLEALIAHRVNGCCSGQRSASNRQLQTQTKRIEPAPRCLLESTDLGKY